MMEENKQHTEEVDPTDDTVEEGDKNMDDSETIEFQSNTKEDRVIELEKELEEVNTRLLRAQADYENLRRRTREEREAATKYRAQSMVEELLPVLDNFERALHVQTDEEQANSLLQGVQMVCSQLIDALQKEGVEEIKAVGQVFDPHLHQAVMQVQSDEHEDNIVVEVLQKGYKLKDRVVRPAMVKVNSK